MFALVLVSRNLCAIKPTFVVILSTYTHGTELELGAILCQITTWFCQFIFSLRWYFRFLLVCVNFRKKLKYLSTLPFPVRNEILSNILFHFCFSFVFGQKVGFDKIVILFQISSAFFQDCFIPIQIRIVNKFLSNLQSHWNSIGLKP